MGGYFLTNQTEDLDYLEKVKKIFRKRGFHKITPFSTDDYIIFYLHKINLVDTNQFYRINSDFIIGVGTFFYKNLFGQNALVQILKDFQENEYLAMLNNIKGHFNIVLYLKGNLFVITDKTGTYHSFIGINDDKISISTSMFSIMEQFSKLTINKQAIMEYSMLNAFLCGKTIVDEIKFLEFGHVFTLLKNAIKKQRYFVKKENLERFSYQSIQNIILDYFRLFNNPILKISVDLSGGLDSRLIYAIASKSQFDFNLNTNINSLNLLDSKIPIRIAKKEKKHIELIEKKISDEHYKQLVKQSYYKNEFFRPSLGAEFSSIFFNAKSIKNNFLIGGYGGELYRDVKFSGINNFKTLLSEQYIEKDIFQLYSQTDQEIYFQNLEKEIKSYLNYTKDELAKEKLEEIYFFIKMMYWGGSRITFFNEYAYRIHPLLDYHLIWPILNVKASEKHEAKFQMKLIEKFNHRIAKYQSAYGYNFVWNNRRSHKISKYMKKGVDMIDSLQRRRFYYGSFKKLKYWIKYLKEPNYFLKFVQYPEIIFEDIKEIYSKIYSIERFLKVNYEKIEKSEQF